MQKIIEKRKSNKLLYFLFTCVIFLNSAMFLPEIIVNVRAQEESNEAENESNNSVNQNTEINSLSRFNTPTDSGLTNRPSTNAFCRINSAETNALLLPECQGKSQCTSTWDGLCGSIVNVGQLLISGTTAAETRISVENGEIPETSTSGLFGAITSVNAVLIDQTPASGASYISEKVYAITNFGEVSAADDPSQDVPRWYYPGTGFSLLSPIQSLWAWSVSIVYGIMILIIIFVAFGILFRTKISGGAYITLQTAVPNIVIAMILVPLSYAIAGAFIDIVTVGTNVTHQFLIGEGSPAHEVYENRNDDLPLSNVIFEQNPTDRGLLPDDPRVSVFNVGPNINVRDEVNTLVNTNGLTTSLNALNGSLLGTNEGWIGDIINLIVGFFLILTGIRIFILLFQKFLVFMLYPAMGPFVFATIAIPGNGTKQIMLYLRMLGAASAFYIITYAMFLLSIIFTSSSFQSKIPEFGAQGYVPPLLGIEAIVRSGNSQVFDSNVSTITGFVLALVALAIYLNIPPTLQRLDKQWGTELKIPEFFTGAIQSARDTVSFTRQNIARAQAVGDRARGIYNAPGAIAQNLRVRSNRALQTVSNVYDRARGIRPGERGSIGYARSVAIQNDISNMERRRLQAVEEGNMAEARRLETNINMAKQRLEGIKTSVEQGGGKLSEVKEAKLTASVEWNGQPTPIVFKEGLMKSMAKMLNNGQGIAADPLGNPIMFLGGGSITLKSEGFRLSPNIANKIRVYRQDNAPGYLPPATPPGSELFTRSQTARSSDPIKGVLEVGEGGLLAALTPPGFTPPAIFSFGVDNIIRLQFSIGNVNPNGEGSVFKIGFNVLIYNIQRLISNVPPFVPLLGPSRPPIETPKYMFEIAETISGSSLGFGLEEPVTSNPVNIAILTDYELD